MTPASVRPSRSLSFSKMLWARTTAYCRYGPVSPSKLSASAMSNTINLLRENFSMKYRMAATAICDAVRASSSGASSGLRSAI